MQGNFFLAWIPGTWTNSLPGIQAQRKTPYLESRHNDKLTAWNLGEKRREKCSLKNKVSNVYIF